MADYQRILSYLYRYEKAEKKECFGFVKAEQKSGSLKLTIQIDDERLLQGSYRSQYPPDWTDMNIIQLSNCTALLEQFWADIEQ